MSSSAMNPPIQDQLQTLTISPLTVTLKRLPHITDDLPNLQTQTNPLQSNSFYHPCDDGFYISHSDVILRQIVFDFSGNFPSSSPHLAYHRAGPRKEIFFDPKQVCAAIVTCGGLCPGLNTVIRELVVGLWELYGVREIFGIKAGYRGFYSGDLIRLDPKLVHNWHKRGGTVLETSRGGFDLQKIVDAIQALEDGQRPLAVRDRRLGGGTIEKIRCKIENASFSKMRSKFLRC